MPVALRFRSFRGSGTIVSGVGIVLRNRLDQGVWNRLKPPNLVGRRRSVVLHRLRGENGPVASRAMASRQTLVANAVESRTKWRSL